jgi:hypothetical protein
MTNNDIRKASECPKCGLKADTLLHPFCQDQDCPVLKALGRTPMGGILEPLVNPSKPINQA